VWKQCRLFECYTWWGTSQCASHYTKFANSILWSLLHLYKVMKCTWIKAGLPYRLSKRSVHGLWTTQKSVSTDSCIKITDKWKCPKTFRTSLPYKISASTVKRFMGYTEKSTYRLFKLWLHYESKCLKTKHSLTLLLKNYDSIQQNLWKLMQQTVKSVCVN
jgi:hypothetical protein